MSAYIFGVVGVTVTSRNFARGCGSSWGDNMDTNFATGAPYKMWEENIQNSARFLTTFDFDLESSPERIDISKTGKYLINYISPPIG